MHSATAAHAMRLALGMLSAFANKFCGCGRCNVEKSIYCAAEHLEVQSRRILSLSNIKLVLSLSQFHFQLGSSPQRIVQNVQTVRGSGNVYLWVVLFLFTSQLYFDTSSSPIDNINDLLICTVSPNSSPCPILYVFWTTVVLRTYTTNISNLDDSLSLLLPTASDCFSCLSRHKPSYIELWVSKSRATASPMLKQNQAMWQNMEMTTYIQSIVNNTYPFKDMKGKQKHAEEPKVLYYFLFIHGPVLRK